MGCRSVVVDEEDDFGGEGDEAGDGGDGFHEWGRRGCGRWKMGTEGR